MYLLNIQFAKFQYIANWLAFSSPKRVNNDHMKISWRRTSVMSVFADIQYAYILKVGKSAKELVT